MPQVGIAETVKVATGEYSPFASEELPENGVTAAIVSAALKTQGVDVALDFLPWKRGYSEAELGKYLGTFPYVKNPEREAAFFYSAPIYTDQVRLFVHARTEKPISFTGKAICVPIGFDTSLVQGFIAQHSMTLEQPSEMSQCFKMLDKDRVAAVWASELVGQEITRSLFGKTPTIYPLEINPVVKIEYYFIISRKLPDAKKWLSRFNVGLKVIKSNGNYKRIVSRFIPVS